MDRKVLKRKKILCCKVNNTFMEVSYVSRSQNICASVSLINLLHTSSEFIALLRQEAFEKVRKSF